MTKYQRAIGPLQAKYDDSGALVAIVDHNGTEVPLGAASDGLTLYVEQAPYAVDMTGVAESSDGFQEALDVAYEAEFPTNKAFGKGKILRVPDGVTEVQDLLMSTWQAIHCPGPLGSTVLRMGHEATSGTHWMISIRDDSGQDQGIGSQPTLIGVVMNGNKSTYPVDSTAVEHGIYMPLLSGDKDDAPLIRDSLIANFHDDGIHINKHHNQVRGFNFKSIAHDGWGLKIIKNSDSKVDVCGIGRSLQGQVYLEDCASPQFAKFDFWNPGGFLGRHAVEIYSCQNARFFQGEINGAVLIQGDDDQADGRTRFQDVACLFNGVTFKVDPATATGPNAGAYDALINIKSASHVSFANCHAGWNGSGEDSEHEYSPNWIWKIGPASGADTETSGFVVVNNFSFIRQHRDDEDAEKPRFGFKKHWTNRRDRVVWQGKQIGELVCVPTSEIGINLVPADGSALDTERWPLLWLTMSASNDWDDGGKPATFTPDAYDPAGTPSHMTWCYVGWL